MILYTVNFDKLRDLSLDDIGNSLKLYLFGFSGNQKILGMDSNVLTIMTWTLPYEWRFYMALPLFCVLTKIIKFHSPVLFLLLFIFVFFPVCGSHFGKYFFTGCLSAVLFNKYEIKNNSTRIIVFLLGNASLIGSFFINGDYYGNTIFIFISVFFLSLVVSKPVFLSNKLFIYCGETSYSIYLCHTIFIVGVSYLVYLLFGVTDVNSYTSILIYSISALLIAVFSFFSYKYIEYPFLKK